MNRSIISVLIILFLTIGLGGFVYLKKMDNKNLPLSSLDFIPVDYSSFILEVQNPSQNFEELFNSNLIWKELGKFQIIKEIENFWNQADTNFVKLKSNVETITIFSKQDSDDVSFLLKTKKKITRTVNFSNWNIKNKENFYIISKKEDFSNFPQFTVTVKSLSQQKDINLLKETVGIEKDKIVLYTKKDTQWSVLDVSFTPDQLFFNGYKKTKKAEVKNITSTLDLSVFSVMPTSFSSFKLIHFGTLDQLPLDSGYLVSKSDECGCDASYLGLGWVESPFTFLKNDLGGATYFISKINNLSDYRHAINNVVSDSLFNELDDESKVRKITNGFDYSSLFYEKTKFTAVVRINDFAIFSNSKENLERLLFQLYSNLTIDKNEKLVEFLKNNINKKSEFIEVSNGMKFMDFSLEEGISIFQSNSKKENLGYTSMLYSKEIKIDGTQTNPKWTLNLGAILNEKIYVVNNHRTNDKDYLIQDKNNIVSFVTPNGEIKWKKNIGNPIVGDIKNIDVLGNNKYQMIFNTKNQLFLIDILGRDVSDFPVKILDSATTNVSVMDYDKSQNFRFLVPTTKGIKSIDKSGNIVKGWKQPMASRTVRGDITHLLVSSKDYIVAADTSNSLYFYNRKGEERHTVSATFGYPIHFKKGSNISNSRAIFLDKKSNSISRQFFSKKDPSYLITPEAVINDFIYMDFDADKELDFVLIFENKIEIYNQDLIKTESIELPINAKKIKVFSKGYGFINQFGDLSIMVNGKLKIVNNVNDFEIDYYKNTLRVLVIGEKEFKLLYL